MKITLEQKDLLEIYGQLGVVGGSAVMVQFSEVDKKKMLENIEKAISEIKKILDNAVITS
jgi:tryptophan synthase alpha subunit